MSTEQATHTHAPARRPAPTARDLPRILLSAIGRVVPAAVVLLVPVVVVPLASAFVEVPAEDDGRYPVWAVEAFGAELLNAALAALSLPLPVLMLYGAVAVAVPPVGAILGLGTIGRWASLAGFCLVGSALGGLLGLGLLLELVAPDLGGTSVRLEILVGLAWPLLAIEGLGCLLAASVAPSSWGRSGT